MFMNSWTVLGAAGLTVESEAIANGQADAIFAVTVDDIPFTIAIEFRARAPYPNEISQLSARREELAVLGVPLVLSDYVSEGTGALLREAGWSYVDRSGNADVAARGVRIQRRVNRRDPSVNKTNRLPTGEKAWKVIRELIEREPSESVTALSERAGVSQPRTSQVLRDLEALELLQKTGRSSWIANRRGLAEAFLDQYPGPGGSTTWWYSLAPSTDVGAKLLEAYPTGLLSGDPAADMVAPWGTPEKTVFYPNAQFEPDDSLVNAHGPGDGNIQIVHHGDRSIGPAAAPIDSLVRPTQLIWDLQALGGDTRAEMIDRVITWMVKN